MCLRLREKMRHVHRGTSVRRRNAALRYFAQLARCQRPMAGIHTEGLLLITTNSPQSMCIDWAHLSSYVLGRSHTCVYCCYFASQFATALATKRATNGFPRKTGEKGGVKHAASSR